MPDLNVFDSITAQDVFLGFRFDVLIDGTIFDATEQGNNSPCVVFTSAQVGYVFYVDANGDLVYRKTTDGGLQFGSPVVVFTDAVELVHGYAVWYDRWTPGRTGTEIHITWMVTDKSIRYRSLDTNGDALGTGSNVATGLSVVSSSSLYPSITVSTIGNIFVSGGTAGGGNRDIWKSEDGGSTFVATTPAFISGVSDEIQLIATDNVSGDICAVQLNSNVKDLESIIYDETTNAWQTPVVIDGDFVNNSGKHRFGWGAALDELSGDIYVVGSNNPNSASNDIRAYRFSSGAWSTLTDVFTNVGAENSISHPFIDRCGNVFAIYTRGSAGAELGFFKKSTDKGVTWSDEVLFGVSPDDVTITRPVPQGDNAYSIGYNNDLDSLLGASLEISDLCLKSEETFDSVTVTEDVVISIDRGFSVFDALTAIEFIDVFLDQLFIDVQEPFSILADEFVELLDLIVEVGIVADSTLATENVNLFLDELFVSVDDGVSIIETVNVSIDPLIFSGQDSLLVSEFFNAITFSSPIDIEAEDAVSVAEFALIDLIIEIATADEFIVIEEADLDLLVALSVDDTVTITEAVTLSVIIGLNVADTVAVTEQVTVVDLVIELGVVADTIDITEVVQIIDIVVEVGVVADLVTVSESVTISLDQLFLSVSDAVVITEQVTVVLPVLNFAVDDSIAIVEFVQVLDIVIELSASDLVSVAEAVTILIPNLFSSVEDSVLITEVVQLIDIVIELGVVADLVTVTESVTVSIGELFVVVSDDIVVTEFADVFDPIVELSASDTAAVVENVTILLPILQADAADTITVTEAVTILIPVLVPSVFDTILIVEVAQITDIVIELGVVADLVTVAEDVVLSVGNLFTSVNDSVTVTESVTVLLPVLNLAVNDAVAVAEFVDVLDIIIELSGFDVVSVAEVVTLVLPNLFLSAEDLVGIVEDVSLTIDNLFIGVDDSVTVAEDVTVSLDVLNINVIEPFSVLVTESVSVVDLVVEVGVVADFVLIVELGAAGPDPLPLPKPLDQILSDIAVNEIAVLGLSELSLFVFEAVAVDEVPAQMFLVSVDDLSLSAGDDIATNEIAAASVDQLFLSAAESVDVDEVQVAASVIATALEGVDAVTIAEAVSLLLSELFIVVDEGISVVESVSIVLPLLLAVLVEDVVAAEFIAVVDLVIEAFGFDVVTVSEFATAPPTVADVSVDEPVTVVDAAFIRFSDAKDFPCIFEVAPRKRFFTIDVCEPVRC